MIAIVDSGPLYAAVDSDDRQHERCVEMFRHRDFDLVVPSLVIAEVVYILGRRLGSLIEAEFIRGLSSLEVETPSREDWAAIADLVERYRNFPLGGTDASIAVLAERLETDLIVTLDRRHFGAIRMSNGRPFRILPE